MKIIISGGYGYSNLGDDAILIATINNIYRVYPNSEIIVLSTNPDETYQNIQHEFGDVKLSYSFHSILIGNQKRNISNGIKIDGIPIKILRKFKFRCELFLERMISIRMYKDSDKMLQYIDKYAAINYKRLFENADMYLMTGGGYLNDWLSMDVCKYLEVRYARKYNVPVVVLGQTIGIFKNKFAKKIVKELLLLSNKVIFRDNDSYCDFDASIINSTSNVAMPDIATSDKLCYKKNNSIVVIPFNGEFEKNEIMIIRNLQELSNETGFKIVVTVSQIWPYQIKIASGFYQQLRHNNISSELIIPQNYCQLQKVLGEANLVISQNLHGLIMAYRAGASIICLNRRRKFVSYMDQINQSSSIIEPSEIKTNYDFWNLYNSNYSKPNITEKFVQDINHIFQDVFNNLIDQ